jgi:hypothetical protein
MSRRPPTISLVSAFMGLSMAVSFGTGCTAASDDAVRVTISFVATDPATPLRDLTLISGGDKYSWPVLTAGETRNVNLLPGLRDDRQLTLLYTLQGRKKSWDGPRVAPTAGYRIEVKVDAAGNVAHRHCSLPCSLR